MISFNLHYLRITTYALEDFEDP